MQNHAEWIREAVKGMTPVELVAHLATDGFMGVVEKAEEIIALCQQGKFEEAAQAAHMDGWL
ncbi:hypothetical protein GCM10007416_35880 [Kroppenstedtia guangzhouensis]|uniref:Uncharacterized protein n=1 Tax=Kroppenstedtia guangzhouensis TaxID=1274356 RepID=A0ABQ1H5U4_9BACL|nr:hypothetical protein [Kroppenstedtia guangzhouensis]GGA59844.1 hypothetical protein GCM10007416_35880 [Kroppenstedtia guangzhouensis]